MRAGVGTNRRAGLARVQYATGSMNRRFETVNRNRIVFAYASCLTVLGGLHRCLCPFFQ